MNSETIVEIERSKNRHNRMEYYTTITLVATKGVSEECEFVIDTGSHYTIISEDLLSDEFKRNIVQHKNDVVLASDVSDRLMTLVPITIKKFVLTPEVILKDTIIYLTHDVKRRAILGMDIFSLFEFVYKHERNQIIGTFWLINPERMLTYLNNKYINNNKTITPRSVMMLEDKKSRFKCIHRTKYKNKIISYTILDEKTGNTKEVSRQQLIQALKENKITVQNLKLTSDYKIITTESIETTCK